MLGLALGLLVSGFTYFNDQVIRQTYLIGNHLPIGVFGPAVLVLLVVNPLVGLVRRGWMLRGGELAVAVAIGLAACGWPGSNLLRVFVTAMGRPASFEPVKPAWQSQHVRAYVPGGSSDLAEGYVTDWVAWAKAMVPPHEPGPAEAGLWAAMPGEVQEAVSESAATGVMEPRVRAELLDAVNAAIREPGLLTGEVGRDDDPHTAALANRDALTAAFAGIIKPRPMGQGVLPLGGRYDLEVTGTLVSPPAPATPADGQSPGWLDWLGGQWSAAAAVPWGAWWPVLRLWLGLALLMGLACVCLALVVHPQWSQRELLLYPTVEFVKEVTQRREGAALPMIAGDRLFWIGLVGVAVLHTINGLNAWFPEVPAIMTRFNLTPLMELFPNARRVSGAWGLFQPALYFTAIGFGYFINSRVSLSLGLSVLLWVAVGAVLLGQGVPMRMDRYDPEATGNALRLGSWLGAVVMIVYFGRRHYWDTFRGSVGLRVHATTPGYCVWAMRGLVVCCLLAVALLMRDAAMSLTMSLLLVGFVLVVSVVLARVNAETGLFYAQPDFLPAALLAGVFGLQGLGPEAFVVLSLAGIVLVIDPREAVMPYITNGLRLGDAAADVRPSRVTWPITGMLVLGLVVATVVTLATQYRLGSNAHDGWAMSHAQQPLDRLAGAVAELSARGELNQVTGHGWLDHFRHMKPEPEVLGWLAGGVAIYIGCAMLRVRLAWWPLHPVLFLMWGTYPINNFAFSFLVASLIKSSIVKVGGITTYQRVKPLMVGLIAGELLAAVGWMIVGTIYYLTTGLPPETYRILPG